MAERLMVGEGNSSPEGSSTQTSQRGVAIAEKSLDQPNVVIADEGKEPKGPGFWRRITGEDTKPLVLVQQPQITEILNPVEQPENTQIPSTPQNQATTGEANAVNNQETQGGQGAGVGNLPPDRRDGGGGRPEGPRGPEGPSPSGGGPPELPPPPTAQGPEGPGEPENRGGESPVIGLTAQEVDLFLKNGYTVEELEGAKAQLGFEKFRQEVDLRVQQMLDQTATPRLTPEEKAQQKEVRRIERIRQLETERESLESMPKDTKQQRRLIELRKARISREHQGLLAQVGGGQEGPPNTPDITSLEYEASPERGRELAEEIIEWEGLRAAGKHNEVEWQRLNELYTDYEIHIEALRLVSMKVNILEPREVTDEGQEFPNVNLGAFRHIDPQDIAKWGEQYRPLAEWIQEYAEQGIAGIQDRERFVNEVNVYFAEAKKVGLLNGLDSLLASLYRRDVIGGIERKLSLDEIMLGDRMRGVEGVSQKIEAHLNSLRSVYRDRSWTDPNFLRLRGVEQLYSLLAEDRFSAAIVNRDPEGLRQRAYLINNEYHIGQEGDEGAPQETYWRLQHGWYIEIYAQTEEEFMIAADTYVSRLEAIAAAPQKIIQEATQFIDVLSKSEGAKRLLQTNPDFIEQLIYGIEARVGVFGADQSNELYNAPYYKEYMDFINKDGKGPPRWLALTKLLDGKIAAALWVLDKDPRMELMFSLFGSRGQLAKSSFAQRNSVGEQGLFADIRHKFIVGEQGLFADIRHKFIEELMGVTIKNKGNVPNVTQWISDRKFTSMFDGLFEYGKEPEGRFSGDANIRAWEEVKNIPEDKLTPAQKQSMRSGRIRFGKLQQELQEGKKISELSEEDRKFYNSFYKKAYKEAEKAFEIAFQMYGALGEKSKRAGGVFKTDEKVDSEGKKFQWFVPIHYAEKFVQFAETWTKIKYADASAKVRTAKVKEARDRAIAAVKNKGFEARLYDCSVIDGHNVDDLFDRNGQPIKIIFDNDGKPTNLNFDSAGKVIVFDKGKNQIILTQDSRAAETMLKRPKEDLLHEDGLYRDINGNTVAEEVEVDFYTATHHSYGDWTSHTYWSYQEEDRHMVLSPTTFDQAKAIRDGRLRPEDALPWAIQLLILDPTLKRVRRFHNNFEDRERKLTMAAVEDSYQSHWRIGRELYRAFFPKYGTPTKDIGVYYGLQDYGGFRKTIEHARARAMEDPERFARRGRRLLPDIHIPAAALSEIWGQGSVGALGVMRMLGAPVYRMGGTFALDKFHAQSEIFGMLYDSLFVSKKDNEGNVIEPLLLKLTNESDTVLQPFWGIHKLGDVPADPKAQQEFCVAVRKSFGRLERYLKLLSTAESLIRNATGAQWLENVDVLTKNNQLSPEFERSFAALPDITREDLTRDDLAKFITEAEAIEETNEEEFNNKFNVDEIDEDLLISAYTGSGRHSARLIFDTIMDLMLDEAKRGGAQLYPTERYIYKHLNDQIVFYNPNKNSKVEVSELTVRDWLFMKMVPT